MTLLSSWSFGQAVRMDDQSDWWSIPNESSQEPEMKVRGEALATENFQIAGASLENDNPQQVEAKLSKAKPVQRGDASTGRELLCYVSGTAREKLHLIFEYGEVDSTVYLFSGGATWKGMERCVSSPKVSRLVSTASGLRLAWRVNKHSPSWAGLIRAVADKIIYVRETQRQTTSKEFERMRREYPQPLGDGAAHEKFDFYALDSYIEARFAGARLNNLAVSTVGTID
jgi:hypothetical protein